MRTTRFSGRTIGVLVPVALVAMVAGAALRGTTDQSPETASPPPSATSPADARGADATGESGPPGTGPRDRVEGVGVGFARTEAGAVAAAVSYTTAGQNWLYLSDDRVAASAGAVTVPQARDRLVSELVDQVRLLRDELK